MKITTKTIKINKIVYVLYERANKKIIFVFLTIILIYKFNNIHKKIINNLIF